MGCLTESLCVLDTQNSAVHTIHHFNNAWNRTFVPLIGKE